MSTTIDTLLASWPPHSVRTCAALAREGYSTNFLSRYRKPNMLVSAGDGALYLANQPPTIFGGLFALQHDNGFDVHLGGESAIEFAADSKSWLTDTTPVRLYGTRGKLPVWFREFNWGRPVRYRCTKMLFEPSLTKGLRRLNQRSLGVTISTNARAMIEYLTRVPQEHSLNDALALMRHLEELSPSEVGSLLRGCRSFKVKRLFLFLAEACGHQWFKSMSVRRIDIGVGHMTLTLGGRFSYKYKMTVPPHLIRERGLSYKRSR